MELTATRCPALDGDLLSTALKLGKTPATCFVGYRRKVQARVSWGVVLTLVECWIACRLVQAGCDGLSPAHAHYMSTHCTQLKALCQKKWRRKSGCLRLQRVKKKKGF